MAEDAEYKVLMRYCVANSDLDSRDVIVRGALQYEILHSVAIPIERPTHWEILVKRRTDGGGL